MPAADARTTATKTRRLAMPAAHARTTATNHSRRRWGRLGTLAAALAAAVAIAGCSSSSTSEEQRSDTYSGAIKTVVLDFDDTGGGQIGYSDTNVSARLVGADRDGVQVDRTLEHTGDHQPEERFEQDGDTLKITVTCPDGFVIGAQVCKGAYEIEVPHGTSVQAATNNGSLTVDATRAATDLHSHGGDLTVTVAPDETAYAVEASSKDGETTVEVPQDPDGMPIRAATEHGDVTVTAAGG
jgi:hypothetical protein